MGDRRPPAPPVPASLVSGIRVPCWMETEMSKLIRTVKRHPAFVISAFIVTAIGSALGYLDLAENISERNSPRHFTGANEAPLGRALRLASSESPTRARADVKTEVVSSFASDFNLRQEEVAQAANEFFRRYDRGYESLMRGGELFGRRQFREAKTEYESAIQFDPENTSALSSLGAVNMMLGDHEAARVAYDSAFQLSPGDWQLQYNYALFFARTGRPRDSLKYLKPALDYLRQHVELRKDLDAVLLELREDPGLSDLREIREFGYLVGAS